MPWASEKSWSRVAYRAPGRVWAEISEMANFSSWTLLLWHAGFHRASAGQPQLSGALAWEAKGWPVSAATKFHPLPANLVVSGPQSRSGAERAAISAT